ncbi:MAG TPA: 3-phosphoshikimate 1-carboxyvinyltransferase [Streptosporangiaceae bacterium]|nr:3-phosphoshikimate 1-carboxyvinyltransferase [Streptosporangiaceae bacterium]
MTEVRVPGSKSVTARALFLAACAGGVTRLIHPLHADDTEAFAAGLAALGYRVDSSGPAWLVTGSPAGPPAAEAEVYCRDAGTAARFLPALAACGRGRFRFDASAQMRRRPVGPLVGALRALGAEVTCEGDEGHLPLTVTADGLAGGHVTLDASVSSQFLTALLMAAPLMRDGLTVTVTGLVSAPYVAMTAEMMRRFGATVRTGYATGGGEVFRVAPGGYTARDFEVEPDASAASYFLAAAALTGHTVTIPGLGSGALQGDVEFARVLERMGARVTPGPGALSVTGTGRLRGVEASMRDISDTMPTLAAIAPFADSPVRITDVGNTRLKECDRLDACAAALRALGVPVATGRDWIEIWPATPKGAVIGCRGDHRIAMSFAVTGLRTPGLTLDDPGCVRKTFPAFHEVLAGLRDAWGLAA